MAEARTHAGTSGSVIVTATVESDAAASRGQHNGEANTISSGATAARIVIVPGDGPRNPRLRWAEGTIDNEHLGRKSSKSCCVYHKPRAFGESSTESSSDESGDEGGPRLTQRRKRRGHRSSHHNHDHDHRHCDHDH
eukprot:UC1_evm3s1122